MRWCRTFVVLEMSNNETSRLVKQIAGPARLGVNPGDELLKRHRVALALFTSATTPRCLIETAPGKTRHRARRERHSAALKHLHHVAGGELKG